MRVPFCKSMIPDMGAVASYLEESIHKGHMSNFGPCYYALVERLSNYLGLPEDKTVVITSSGHTALMAAYSVLGAKRTVMPDFTFESTRGAYPNLAGPLIVDVDPDSGCLSTSILEEIADPFDSVVVVCALGTIPKLDELADWCGVRGKSLIIDGAPTFGTPGVASYGDAYCFSFHATKTLSAGEAGAIVIPKELESRVRSFINFGFGPEKEVLFKGMNAKASEYTCAIIMALLDDINSEVEARLKNAALYKKSIGRFVPKSFIEDTVYASLPTFLPNSVIAHQLRLRLSSLGVEHLMYYKPLSGNSISAEQPVSWDLYRRNICLPVHSGLTEEDINTICKQYLV